MFLKEIIIHKFFFILFIFGINLNLNAMNVGDLVKAGLVNPNDFQQDIHSSSSIKFKVINQDDNFYILINTEDFNAYKIGYIYLPDLDLCFKQNNVDVFGKCYYDKTIIINPIDEKILKSTEIIDVTLLKSIFSVKSDVNIKTKKHDEYFPKSVIYNDESLNEAILNKEKERKIKELKFQEEIKEKNKKVLINWSISIVALIFLLILIFLVIKKYFFKSKDEMNIDEKEEIIETKNLKEIESENVVKTRGTKYSRTKFWVISIILLIISAFIFGVSRMLENINDLTGATIGYSIVTILQLIWVYALSNRVRDYGNNPWIALLGLLPLLNVIFGLYYGIVKTKNKEIIN